MTTIYEDVREPLATALASITASVYSSPPGSNYRTGLLDYAGNTLFRTKPNKSIYDKGSN
jgi:hypothetical protein